ncbi:hypothetical protein [Streptomyces sp. H27-D2]|uniref:hypothetical protein n=1 Tax=Streptomyces sp. H27-D2 TaxID=3046304 RepID=UPI002DBB34DC|nr:hypothetical protein [Streptomyces sp. H27-D2]MEC4016410.1 hypothetical protein [Streptomyces sp. H27-D2]
MSTATALSIQSLIHQFPELIHDLAPGKRSPAARPDLGRPALEAQGTRHRQERQDALWNEQRHGTTPIGGGSAPVRLFISDTIRDITDGVAELEEAVRERLGLVRNRPAPVPMRLRRIAALLELIDARPELTGLATHMEHETRRMARRCARALGDSEQIVRVGGRCPWCDSVSLRAFPERQAVLCINPACRCSDPECPCSDDPAYRHCWAEPPVVATVAIEARS